MCLEMHWFAHNRGQSYVNKIGRGAKFQRFTSEILTWVSPIPIYAVSSFDEVWTIVFAAYLGIVNLILGSHT